MENFKFRCWDTHFKEMRYSDKHDGEFYINLKGVLYQYYLSKEKTYIKSYDVMQFTGLKDISGTDIYADDIIEDEGGRQYRVYSLRGGFGIKAYHWSKDFNDLLGPDTLIIDPLADAQTRSYVTTTCKVIGNIYDNGVY